MPDNSLGTPNATPDKPEGKITWPMVTFRIHQDDIEALDRLMDRLGTNRSEYLRDLVIRELKAATVAA